MQPVLPPYLIWSTEAQSMLPRTPKNFTQSAITPDF
jgi:hypothetical protein